MSRMSKVAPKSRPFVQQVSELRHEAFAVQVIPLGTIEKTEHGWLIPDGTLFLQESDALAQLYVDAGIPLPAKLQAYALKEVACVPP